MVEPQQLPVEVVIKLQYFRVVKVREYLLLNISLKLVTRVKVVIQKIT